MLVRRAYVGATYHGVSGIMAIPHVLPELTLTRLSSLFLSLNITTSLTMSPPASTMSAPSPTKMKSYTTARGIWRRTSEVEILSVFDTRIAAFPIGFLSTCGDNTWHYILFVISLCVDPDSLHPGQLVDDQGEPINLGSIPSAGTYRYLETGT